MEVIILTNDRPDFTALTLQSVALQLSKGERGRLILFDDGWTSAFAAPHVRKVFDFASHRGWHTEYHRNHDHRGVTYARHLASQLVGEVPHFYMIDGDMLVPPGTFAKMEHALGLTSSTHFVVPRLLNIDNEHGAWHDPLGTSPVSVPGDHPHAQWVNSAPLVNSAKQVAYGATACILYRTQPFRAAGGFGFWDLVEEGEEVLMSNRLENKGLLIEDFPVYHLGNTWTKEGMLKRLDTTKRKLVEAMKS